MDGGLQDPLCRGLTEKEATVRLKAEGPNTLPQADRRTFIRIVLEILREPMFALLLGAAVGLGEGIGTLRLKAGGGFLLGKASGKRIL